MKAVMLSIKPQWVEKILSGEKTIEVRKTKPKFETPFKCYIYETRGKSETPIVYEDGYMDFHGRGKVVAEFTCDRINEYEFFIGHGVCGYVDGCESHCLTREELCEYGNGKNLYGWHISELKAYDTLKELGEYGVKKPFQSWGYVYD